MAKSERLITNIKNNFGTYAKINENLSQMGGDEFVYITDRVVPIAPDTNGNYVLNVTDGENTWYDLSDYHDSTKYDASNPSGYQTETQVSTAISSYHDSTKYDASNPSGYQTATQVSTAISNYHDSTKYDASNPSGYQTEAQVSTAISNYHDSTKSGVLVKDWVI